MSIIKNFGVLCLGSVDILFFQLPLALASGQIADKEAALAKFIEMNFPIGFSRI